MKRLLTIICCLFSIASVWAQTSELEGKIISVGSAATTLEAGQWYVLYNAATSAYVLEGEGNTLGVTTASPNGADAVSGAARG